MLILFVHGAAGLFENLDCKPRAMVIPTSADKTFNYFPYFVQLHRCSGSLKRTSPLLVECVADKIEDVYIVVDQNSPKIKNMPIKMQNHTSCTNACVCKQKDCLSPFIYNAAKCQCRCPSDVVGPPGLVCRHPKQIWSNEFCRCMCTNPRTCNNKRQYFDEETCSCKCNSRKKDCQAFGRTFDLDSCACRRTSRSENHLNGQQEPAMANMKFWIGAMLAELVVMLVIFDAVLYYYQSGLVYNLVNMKFKPKQGQDIPRKQEMAYKEILRKRQSLGSTTSTTLRIRSSRRSSVHPAHLPSSPLQRDFQDDVFTS